MKANDPDTNELIRRAAADDPQAIEKLMDRHRDRLQRMVAVRMDKRLSARMDPSDIVQDVLIRAIDNLPDYIQHRPIAFYPWLRRLAWEQMVDAFRKNIVAQRRSVNREMIRDAPFDMGLSDHSALILADALVAQQSTPSQHMVREQRIQQIQIALGQIQSNYRELLIMRYLEELSMKEIAECLGTSEAAIKMCHMRALRQLGGALGSEQELGGIEDERNGKDA